VERGDRKCLRSSVQVRGGFGDERDDAGAPSVAAEEVAFMAETKKAKAASAVSKPGVARGLDAARKSELEKLRQIEQASFKKRERFWERTYLQAVYEVWWSWPLGKKWSFARQSARFCRIQVRPSSHAFRMLIDCTSPHTDEKMKSRWTLALRYARVQRVEPSGLVEFLGGKGGVAGRAHRDRGSVTVGV
jgi:hypothetical protein